MARLFGENVNTVKGIGPKTALLFNKLGVYNIENLIRLYPRTYENWDYFVNAGEFYNSGMCGCIKIKIISGYSDKFLSSGSKAYKIKGLNGKDVINIIFFNDKYTIKDLCLNKEFLVFGNITKNLRGYEMINPKVKNFLKENMGLQAIYPQIKGLSSNKIRSAVKEVLKSGIKINETLPYEFINKYNLCSLEYAIKSIHFPENYVDIDKAKRRLIFDKILIWQIAMCVLKKYSRQHTEIKITRDYTDEFLFLLPFNVTSAQRKSIQDCTEDMINFGDLSMNRLLQGDVGSGKTVVAAGAAYNAVKNGYQVAVMVPTELLGGQHYNTFKKIVEGLDINVEFLSGKLRTSERSRVKLGIESGETDIVIGTHSLISDNVVFSNLGLVIADEQHRFGVKQRTRLIDKGKNPHILIMSATPIPRTLSLILYGDLDISIIDEIPPGRKDIKTFCVGSSKRKRVFDFMKNILSKGHQGYIICPSIEDGETSKASVKSYCNSILGDTFNDFKIEILHGKIATKEREAIMARFAEGKINLLISTTVIEVGIDVPNATIIIIENSEQFGLSQLHQLRGRVGRGETQSYCVLISDSQSQDSIKRFKAICDTNDGFKLANEDLELRGPGEIFGNKQHGLGSEALTKEFSDMNLILGAKETAEDLIKKFDSLQNHELEFLKVEVDKLIDSVKNKVVI